jgi:hypothetical protein
MHRDSFTLLKNEHWSSGLGMHCFGKACLHLEDRRVRQHVCCEVLVLVKYQHFTDNYLQNYKANSSLHSNCHENRTHIFDGLKNLLNA